MRPHLIFLVTAVACMSLAGCSVIHIPYYIKDENPYKRTFYAPFDRVQDLAIKALAEHGWNIEGENDPAAFERAHDHETGSRLQTLLYTQIRKMSFVLGSRLSRINVYLRSTAESATEVELRYLTVTTTNVKTFYDYHNDDAVNKIFRTLEDLLAQP